MILNLILCGLMFFASGCGFPLSQTDGNTPNKTPPNGSGNPSQPGVPHESAEGISERFTAEEDKFAVFSSGGASAFRASTWSNGGMFNCTFSAQNAVVADGVLKMSVTKGNNGYLGGEYQSYYREYSYGYYSVSMKAANCSGVVSSFFTYTNNRDEIDIEFLGKDTTKVQFNYFLKGVGGHEFLYSLGFDAAEDFHEYGFDWQNDSITWFVDGKAVYRVEGDVPDSPTTIMMNVWNGTGVDDWLGPFDESKLPVTGQYKWVGYSAE